MEPTREEVIARLEEMIYDIKKTNKNIDGVEIDWQQLTRAQLLDLLSLLGLPVY